MAPLIVLFRCRCDWSLPGFRAVGASSDIDAVIADSNEWWVCLCAYVPMCLCAYVPMQTVMSGECAYVVSVPMWWVCLCGECAYVVSVPMCVFMSSLQTFLFCYAELFLFCMLNIFCTFYLIVIANLTNFTLISVCLFFWVGSTIRAHVSAMCRRRSCLFGLSCGAKWGHLCV